MRTIRHFAGFVVVAAGLALGACAQVRDEAQVSLGTQFPVTVKAKDYAALYLPYAKMATAAYVNENALDRHHCPDPTLLAQAQAGESASDRDYRKAVSGWIHDLKKQNWECRFGIYGNLRCPPRAGDCHPVGGLEFHVWRRMQAGSCREVAIAFRGTDKNDLGDWISNFRWLYRLVPRFDQYAQVQTHITQIVRRIKRNGCNGAGTQFVSAGHSLGGGLAQQAAYADQDGGIRYVYAFDPSPVTGFFDVSELIRDHSTKGLGVDRAYEQGEILMLPRLIIENIFPPSPCNPRIRSVRFNLLAGPPGAQHSITELTKKLSAEAESPGANARRVEESLRARTCKETPLLPLPVALQSPA